MVNKELSGKTDQQSLQKPLETPPSKPQNPSLAYKIGSAAAIGSMILSACTTAEAKNTDPKEIGDSDTKSSLVLTETPTLTPEPTYTPTKTPTPTETPTEIPTKVEFVASEPIYREEVEGEYMGVHIKMGIETDKSLAPSIKEMRINKNFYQNGKNAETMIMEFGTKVFYSAWKNNKVETEHNLAADDSYEAFMQLWSKAQETEDPELWNSVAMTIKIDDPSTEGYSPQPVVIWPMFEGQPPEGVLSFTEFNTRFTKKTKDQTVEYRKIEDNTLGYSVFIESQTLNLYLSIPSEIQQDSGFVYSHQWENVPKMFLNIGFSVDSHNLYLGDIISNRIGGAAISPYPQSDWEHSKNP